MYGREWGRSFNHNYIEAQADLAMGRAPRIQRGRGAIKLPDEPRGWGERVRLGLRLLLFLTALSLAALGTIKYLLGDL